MLENTSRIAIIVIAVCLSFNVLRDLVGMFVGTATAQTYSVPIIAGCLPTAVACSRTDDPNAIPAVPVVQVRPAQ
jgi:hypothetical protein